MCYCFHSFKELSASCRPIFRPGCKGTSLYFLNQIFLLFLEDFNLHFLTKTFEELPLFFEADGKDTRRILITKFFFQLFKNCE